MLVKDSPRSGVWRCIDHHDEADVDVEFFLRSRQNRSGHHFTTTNIADTDIQPFLEYWHAAAVYHYENIRYTYIFDHHQTWSMAKNANPCQAS